MKRLMLLLLLALVFPASAKAYYGFKLTGYHASPYMRMWAHESKMPLPPDKVWVGFGNPAMYGKHSIYLPSCCTEGWTHLAIEGLLYHELGHVYDATRMTPTLRDEFRQMVGVPLVWNWWRPMRTVRWVTAPDYYITIAPGEMFAEEYAACSLGLTQFQYQEAGFNSYGWVPPQGTDETALCNLIRSAA